MTLTVYTSDKLFSNKVGLDVANTDPTPNPYMREQLLNAIKTLLNAEKYPGKIQVYSHLYELCSNLSKFLKDLKKEITRELAETKIKFEDSKVNQDTEDYTFYENQILAYNNVLDFVNQQIEKGGK